MGDLTESSTPQPAPSRQVPFREDCWTEEATSTLVDAWGRRYLELNRGNLRQKDWQTVADIVNARHGHTKKTQRTDVQCKNRIDTLKKKYKIEKAKISDSNGTLTSSWPFYSRLELLIGSNVNKTPSKFVSTAKPLQSFQPKPPSSLPSPPMGVMIPYLRSVAPETAIVTPMILPQKRPMPSQSVDESYFRRNYSAMAAAAAAAEDEADEDEDDGESEGEEAEGSGARARAGEEEGEGEGEGEGEEGMRMLAKAIERFGHIYEKVESMKQRQMIELEKQRMQFAKDLEVQRMRLFMDTQVQLEKIKQTKQSGPTDDIYS